jgi:hypothetical protein
VRDTQNSFHVDPLSIKMRVVTAQDHTMNVWCLCFSLKLIAMISAGVPVCTSSVFIQGLLSRHNLLCLLSFLLQLTTKSSKNSAVSPESHTKEPAYFFLKLKKHNPKRESSTSPWLFLNMISQSYGSAQQLKD